MYKVAPMLFAFALFFAGCAEEAPPPVATAEAPPEPTPAEIRAELNNALQILSSAANSSAAMPPFMKDEAVRAVNQVKGKHAAKENGQKAIQEFTGDVEKMIATARDNESWMVVKGGAEIYRSLSPASDRYTKLEEKADVMLSRPQVEVTGFIAADGVTDIFVRTTDHEVNPPVQTHTVREGEEFHEKTVDGKTGPVLKVSRIVGANQAVEFEYLPINDTWIVQGPKQF